MVTRRGFITQLALAGAGLAVAPGIGAESHFPGISPNTEKMQQNMRFTFPSKIGFGGVAAGNGFQENSSEKIQQTLKAAWDQGVRYFDTSPWYGLGLSERRFGHFLFEQPRDAYLLSTKIGRILEPDAQFTPNEKLLWKGKLNFRHRYDYTASGVRRSIEDSLQRLGLSSIDIVLVHDLSSDNQDLGDQWTEQFDIAAKGAFPELSKMREEGIIKAWGMGVNTPEPILRCMEVADPDVMLVAIQYSLVDHKHALNHLFPKLESRGIPAIIGGPLNSGFLANRDRFNYSSNIPAEMLAKREEISRIIKPYGIELSTVALQFCAAHPVVGSVIPGASNPEQAIQNTKSLTTTVPADLWAELKRHKLIEENAPV